jgi:general secretion pathway protein C
MATIDPVTPGASRNLPGTFVLAALVLLLAWQLAYWTWHFATPAPMAARAVSSDDAVVDLSLAARLFGGTASSASSALTSSLRLKGVVAPTPGIAASAIFSLGSGKDVAIFVGSEVQPGLKLSEVHPDHVIVTRGGVNERIDLETRRSLAGAGPGQQAARVAGFKLNVARSGTNSYSLSRKELDDTLRDPNQLNYLGQISAPPGGGVRMEQAPPGSLAQKLGLQPGDVIKKLNGQTVASPGDLARLYQQFGTLTSIQAEIQRAGSSHYLSYTIQP